MMPAFALLSPKVWIEIAVAALIAGVCWWGYNTVYNRGAESVQVKWDAEKADTAIQSAKVATDALAVTKDLIATSEKEKESKNAQIKALNASNASLLVELSKRPSRDSSGNLPRDPTTGSTIGATGADLPRQDAAFLVWEGTRFDKLRLNLIECQNKYNNAYNKMKRD
jgi:hypothetical protein